MTDMSITKLEAHIAELMAGGRVCALNGCRMLYDGEQRSLFDEQFLVSTNRIDSDQCYAP